MPMSFCRINHGPHGRGHHLAFLLASITVASLIILLTATSAYAATGDEWVLGSQSQVWPDAVEPQQFADIDGTSTATG
ncbi:MAG: hypothetical protein C4534_06890 [Gaiellales bacterium]|nr:MAG: hypothetical protein C4534_06890 [Gaiellales bacterium]